jgi:prepilin-type N-terminal cleavage/methylation domain-containing protein
MNRARGFTLIELIVVICVVALLFGVALDRLQRYRELAERVAMERNLAAMNVALTLKFASLVISGRAAEIEKEAGTNPVRLLARPPENYLGELYAPDPATIAEGSWFFDRQAGELVYVPSRTRYLSFPSESPGKLHFRIFLTAPSQEPGAPRELAQPFVGPVRPFGWATE